MADGPSIGMKRRRQEVQRRLQPPWREALAVIAAMVAMWLLIKFQSMAGDFVFEGKAGFIWLIPPAVALWYFVEMISWPFRRKTLKRELEYLHRFDRLKDFREAYSSDQARNEAKI